MSRIFIAVLLCGAVGSTALAQCDANSGLCPYVMRNGSPIQDDSIICWYKTSPQANYYELNRKFTDDQNWPPNYNVLRYAYENQSAPRFPIDTCKYYVFYAKRLIGSTWYYSAWSVSHYYAHPTTKYNIELVLNTTTEPGDPNEGEGDR